MYKLKTLWLFKGEKITQTFETDILRQWIFFFFTSLVICEAAYQRSDVHDLSCFYCYRFHCPEIAIPPANSMDIQYLVWLECMSLLAIWLSKEIQENCTYWNIWLNLMHFIAWIRYVSFFNTCIFSVQFALWMIRCKWFYDIESFAYDSIQASLEMSKES